MNIPATHAVNFLPVSRGILMRRILHAPDAVHKMSGSWFHNSAALHLLTLDHYPVVHLRDSAAVADGLPSANPCG